MAKKTKALLVGINDYYPVGPGGSDLNGCVNDVRDMANTLVICGYNPLNIRILTDQRATRSAILENLIWLLAGAEAGDSIVFYYSGHGSYKIDLSNDEPDGRDEVICPHDWPKYISDDDLAGIFANLPSGVLLEIIMDCCHSGTNTRNLVIAAASTDGVVLIPRFIQPPFDDTFYEEFKVSAAAKTSKLLNSLREIAPVPAMNHVLWAGCRDRQLSNETNIDGQMRGIFTYHLCSVLRSTSGQISRERLDALVTASVARHGYDQIPQLEGDPASFSKTVFA